MRPCSKPGESEVATAVNGPALGALEGDDCALGLMSRLCFLDGQ